MVTQFYNASFIPQAAKGWWWLPPPTFFCTTLLFHNIIMEYMLVNLDSCKGSICTHLELNFVLVAIPLKRYTKNIQGLDTSP